MSTHRRWTRPVGSALLLFLTTTPALRAQVTTLSDFEVDNLVQTGPTTAGDVGWFFDSRLDFAHAGDVATATLTYPGPGSPSSYSLTSATELDNRSATFASQSALQTAYPAGPSATYTVNYGGGTQPSGTVTITDSQSPFPNVPLFTAATYANAQGLNAGQAQTFAWNAFTNPTTDAFIFFSISNATTGVSVYSASFLSPTITSQMVPANTLVKGTTYIADIDFSSRLDGTSNNITTFQGFDRATSLTFTAAPEPSAGAVFAVAGLGLAVLARKSRQRHAEA